MAETIKLEEIWETKPSGFLEMKGEEILLNLDDGTIKKFVCDCSHSKFYKLGCISSCQSCGRKTLLITKKEEKEEE